MHKECCVRDSGEAEAREPRLVGSAGAPVDDPVPRVEAQGVRLRRERHRLRERRAVVSAHVDPNRSGGVVVGVDVGVRIKEC